MMTPRQRSAQALAVSWPLKADSVCVTCRHNILRRQYSAAAATAPSSTASDIATPPTPSSSQTHATDTRTQTRPQYQLRAGVVLSRPPVITRDLHPFEKSFFLYQRRLNERTAMPFSRYFYIKRGTPADVEWKRKMQERLTPARDIGVYNAYSKEGWNDELLIGAKESEPQHQVEALLRDAEEPGARSDAGDAAAADASDSLKNSTVVRPASRITEADRENDQQSLNRLLQRTLYLLVKDGQGQWQFPNAQIAGREGLNKAAERVVFETGGSDMNTWIVGNVPIGHLAQDFSKPVADQEQQTVQLGQKTFFMKARIMSGQANLEASTLDYGDFRWLAKEEIQKLVTPGYWAHTQNMLSER